MKRLKEQGSAMVLAVLILAFFMTLSLNMYFLAEKKAQRAGVKSEGTVILSDIDASSTLGYYELFLASEYLTKGFYNNMSKTDFEGWIAGTNLTTPIGIKINNPSHYFSNFVSGTIAGTTGTGVITTQAGINLVETREWDVVDNNLEELWEDYDKKSIGGYKISGLEIAGAAFAFPLTYTNFAADALQLTVATPTKQVITVYEKVIVFPTNGGINEKSEFHIKVTRKNTLGTSGSSYKINFDRIETIEVIKQ